MEHIVARTWNDYNRSSRIEHILTALNNSGKAEAKYFKGRSQLAVLFMGRGHPEEMNETDTWNQVEITYKGKDAVEIFDSRLGPEGHIFTEHFTEDETNEIKTALADVQIYTWQEYLSQNRLTKPLYVSLMLVGLILALDNLISGNSVEVVLGLGLTLISLFSLLRR